MDNKKKAELKTEIYAICLELNYSVETIKQHKEDLREQIGELTKTINKSQKRLKEAESYYKNLYGVEPKYKR